MQPQSTPVCSYCHQPAERLIRQRRENYGKLMCSSCDDERWRAWRRTPQRRETNRQIAAERYASRRDTFHRLKEKPCEDCGGTFPHYVMEFDHPDRSIKTGTISMMLSASGYALTPKILAEIAKCSLLCANCHRIRTRQQWERGEWKGGRNRLPDEMAWARWSNPKNAKKGKLSQSA